MDFGSFVLAAPTADSAEGPDALLEAVAPVYGSRIGYAPVDPDRATAPGKYDLATLRSPVDRLLAGDTGPDAAGSGSPRAETPGPED